MMIETDVSLGWLKAQNPRTDQMIPIMAHPPANTSDISLEEFMSIAASVSQFNFDE